MPRNRSEKNRIIQLTPSLVANRYITVWYLHLWAAGSRLGASGECDALRWAFKAAREAYWGAGNRELTTLVGPGEGHLGGERLKDLCVRWMDAHDVTAQDLLRVVLSWD